MNPDPPPFSSTPLQAMSRGRVWERMERSGYEEERWAAVFLAGDKDGGNGAGRGREERRRGMENRELEQEEGTPLGGGGAPGRSRKRRR